MICILTNLLNYPNIVLSMRYKKPKQGNMSSCYWDQNICMKKILVKKLGGQNVLGPKRPGAEMSRGRNVWGPKRPGAETSLGPKRLCAETSLGPKCPGAETSRGRNVQVPKRPRGRNVCVPKRPWGRNVRVPKCPLSRNVQVPKRPWGQNIRAETSCAEISGAETWNSLTTIPGKIFHGKTFNIVYNPDLIKS